MQQKLFLPCGRSVCGSAKAGGAGSGISTNSGELCMEALFKRKYKQKKRANKVKVGMNPCLLSGFFPFPSSCLQSSVTPGCWKCLQGRSSAPGAGTGCRDPLGSVSRHCSQGCLGGAAGDGPQSSQDFQEAGLAFCSKALVQKAVVGELRQQLCVDVVALVASPQHSKHSSHVQRCLNI